MSPYGHIGPIIPTSSPSRRPSCARRCPHTARAMGIGDIIAHLWTQHWESTSCGGCHNESTCLLCADPNTMECFSVVFNTANGFPHAHCSEIHLLNLFCKKYVTRIPHTRIAISHFGRWTKETTAECVTFMQKNISAQFVLGNDMDPRSCFSENMQWVGFFYTKWM